MNASIQVCMHAHTVLHPHAILLVGIKEHDANLISVNDALLLVDTQKECLTEVLRESETDREREREQRERERGENARERDREAARTMCGSAKSGRELHIYAYTYMPAW